MIIAFNTVSSFTLVQRGPKPQILYTSIFMPNLKHFIFDCSEVMRSGKVCMTAFGAISAHYPLEKIMVLSVKVGKPKIEAPKA